MARSAAVAAAATGEPELAPRGLWVVKLGGSLAHSLYLKRWLTVLAGGGAAVIVPGGGPFADQVPALRKRRRFDDTTAHPTALLAMEQYGRMLAGLQPGLRPLTSCAEGWCIDDARHAEMAAALESGRGPGTQIVADAPNRRRAHRRLPVVAGMLTSSVD